MFCPEDGTKIEPVNPGATQIVVYSPCPECRVRWVYRPEPIPCYEVDERDVVAVKGEPR